MASRPKKKNLFLHSLMSLVRYEVQLTQVKPFLSPPGRGHRWPAASSSTGAIAEPRHPFRIFCYVLCTNSSRLTPRRLFNRPSSFHTVMRQTSTPEQHLFHGLGWELVCSVLEKCTLVAASNKPAVFIHENDERPDFGKNWPAATKTQASAKGSGYRFRRAVN